MTSGRLRSPRGDDNSTGRLRLGSRARIRSVRFACRSDGPGGTPSRRVVIRRRCVADVGWGVRPRCVRCARTRLSAAVLSAHGSWLVTVAGTSVQPREGPHCASFLGPRRAGPVACTRASWRSVVSSFRDRLIWCKWCRCTFLPTGVCSEKSPSGPFLPTGVCSEKSRSGRFSQLGCVRRNPDLAISPNRGVFGEIPEKGVFRRSRWPRRSRKVRGSAIRVGGGAKRRRRHYIAPSRSGLETPDQSTADPRQDQQVPAVAADRPNGGFWSGDDRKTTTYN